MSTSTPGTLGPGAEFGPYSIVRQVGRGAFGVVYETRRKPLKKRMALKILHEHVLSSPDAVTRFQREIVVAAQVDHPHVIQVFDGGVTDERGFLAMEFLEGETLAERLKRDKTLPVEEVVDVILPMCSALDAVHDAGVVHRDIKPGNIFLTRHVTGAVHPKLVDFGIAKLVSDDLDLTETHSWLGTPFYMSPEQVRQSKSVDARADQWSLAVVLYECLTGEKPFRSDVLLDLLEAITTRSSKPPSEVNPAVPKGLDAVIARMLERDPLRRYPSMNAAGAALWTFASPRMRATWAKHFGREADPAARLDDAIELRDSSFPEATSLDATTVHHGKADALPLVRRAKSEVPGADARPAWQTLVLGAAVGMGAILVGQKVLGPNDRALRSAIQAEASLAPPAARPLPLGSPTPAPAPAPPSPQPAVATPVAAPPSVAAADASAAPVAHALARASSGGGGGGGGDPAPSPSVRGAPYCDDDSSVQAACASLQGGDRGAALQAFRAMSTPRALVATAHLMRQSGRLVDAEEKLAQALRESGDAWMSAHTSFTNTLLADIQGHLGAVQVDCPSGEVSVGSDGASRHFTLPHPQPVRSPTGRVQVILTTNGAPFTQFVTVRADETQHVTTCSGGGAGNASDAGG